jgi:hypothetical protein
MSRAMTDYIVKINNEKLREALKVLESAVEPGNIAPTVDIKMEDDGTILITSMWNSEIVIHAELAPLLALKLVRTYFDVMRYFEEMVEKFKEGVWKL